jgi:hypothetical protein
MIIGLSLAHFTLLHVIISLIAIASGVVVFGGLLASNRLPGWTALFLLTTVLTSVTGFMFPISAFTPALAFGVISVIVLAFALVALYGFHLAGGWRAAYVVTALLALYLNMFVLVVQGFQKVPFLNALAPTQSEPPFAIAQAVLLIAFLWLGWRALTKFHPESTLGHHPPGAQQA